MISLGANFGGPELSDSGAKRAYLSVANGIRGALPRELTEWKGRVPGVNVVFYVPGSVLEYEYVNKIAAARFSRKRKLVLVNVPVPKTLVADYSGSRRFMFDSLLKANEIAAARFASKGVAELFDWQTANSIVAQARQACESCDHEVALNGENK
jgi:hypothetical protein